MAIALPEDKLLELQAMLPTVGDGEYWQVYEWLANTLEEMGVPSSNQSVLWLRGATEANRGTGAMSALIREFTQTQAELRLGIRFDAPTLQLASDNVARNLIRDLLGESSPVWARGDVPDLERIALADATAVGLTLFNQNPADTASNDFNSTNAAWAGALLFSQLGSDQSFRLLKAGNDRSADTLNDWRDVMFAQYAYEKGLLSAGLTFAFELNWQKAVDLQILTSTQRAYLQGGKTKQELLQAVTTGLGDGDAAGKPYSTVANIGRNRFLEMLIGARTGQAKVGTTIDSNFVSQAHDFFAAFTAENLQGVGARYYASSNELAAAALSDVNARAALGGLSLVALDVSTDVADRFTLFDEMSGSGEITQNWVSDRASMLTALLNANPALGGFAPRPGPDLTIYRDVPTGVEAGFAPDDLTIPDETHYVLFGGSATGASLDDSLYGGSQADTLDGAGGSDFLFGGGGNDVLEGGDKSDSLMGAAGDDKLDGGPDQDMLDGGMGDDTLVSGADSARDVLRGGAGNDHYDFSGGFGSDVIEDSDGQGVLTIDGTQLGGSFQAVNGAENVFDDPTGIYRAIRTGGATSPGLLVWDKAGGTARSVYISTWTDGQFGISLGAAPPATTPPPTAIVGDRSKVTETYTSTVLDGSGNPVGNWTGEHFVTDINGYELGAPQANAPDILFGGLENDTILGLGGNDGLWGYDGNDLIDGGDGDDLIYGGKGKDTLIGGEGRDYLFGSHDRTSQVTRYRDRVEPDGGWSFSDGGWIAAPWIEGDTTPGSRGFSWSVLPFGSGGDLNVDAWGVRLTSNDGDEGNLIGGGAGDDVLVGGDGADSMLGGADNDSLFGLGGADLLSGDANDDYIDGDGPAVDGYEQIWSGEVAFGSGTVFSPQISYTRTEAAKHGNDTINGGDGADTLVGRGGDDLLIGGIGNDGLFGDNRYIDEEDTPTAKGSDSLYGDAGADTIFGGFGGDLIDGGDDDDWLYGDWPGALHSELNGNDTIYGGSGKDHVRAGYGADTVFGGEGDDDLWGGMAEAADGSGGADDLGDSIDGGAGNDQILGEGGDDTLVGGAGNDAIWGGLGADSVSGGDDNDTLYGNDNNDWLSGGDGADELYGGSGNDTLIGGGGSDVLEGGEGDDVYYIGLGDMATEVQADGSVLAETINDMLGQNSLILGNASSPETLSSLANGGDLIIQAGAGQELYVVGGNSGALVSIQVGGRIYDIHQFRNRTLDEVVSQSLTGTDAVLSGGRKADFLTAFGGRNTLMGGRGDDSLTAIGGNNTLTFELGDGNDTFGTGGAGGVTGAPNRIVFGEGISSESLRLLVSGGKLVIAVGEADSIALKDANLADVGNDPAIEQFVFADSSTLSWSALVARGVQVVGTASAEVLQGTNAADTIIGGGGDDTMDGGDGSNTFRLGEGSGFDTIDATGYGAGNTLTLEFGPEVTPDQLAFSFVGDALQVSYADSAVVLTGFLSQLDAGSMTCRFEFSDGTNWTELDIAQRFATGGPGDDVLLGTTGADFLEGFAGDDQLVGLAGNDTLVGGAGADTLEGGSGDDLYVLGPNEAPDGANVETIDDTGGRDLVQLLNVTTLDQITSSSAGKDLVVVLQPDGGKLIFKNGLLGSIETIENAQGAQWSIAQLIGSTLYETRTLTSQTASDLVFGGSLSDNLTIQGANSTVSGGRGSDMLYLQASGTTVSYSRGDGYDQVYVYDGISGPNVLSFGEGILPSDISVSVEYEHFIVNISDPSSGTVTGSIRIDSPTGGPIQRYFDESAPPVAAFDKVQFADGTTTTFNALLRESGLSFLTDQADTLSGTNGGDVVVGYAGDDLVDTGGSGDWVLAGAGNDTVVSGDGDDRVYGQSGNDSLDTGAGDDVAIGGDGADIILGGAGNDLIYGDDEYDAGAGNDTLFGGDGDDTLRGYGGADELIGGNGTNTLEGGAGSDVYRLGLGSWADTIQDFAEPGQTNAIVFDSGITPGNVTLSRIYNDLKIIVTSPSDGALLGVATVEGQFVAGGERGVDEIRFADGTIWNSLQYLAQPGAVDVPHGWLQGPDKYYFGSWSSDTITGSSAADTIYGDIGDDLLLGVGGGDQLVGGAGNDTLDGGRDSLIDRLAGGDGNDTYRFGVGYGEDWISEYDVYSWDIFPGGSGNDTVELIDGILQDNVVFSRDPYGLYTLRISGSDAIQFNADIENIAFSDGTVWSDLQNHLTMANVAPYVGHPIDDIVVIAGANAQFSIRSNAFQDANPGDTLSYSASLADGTALPTWLTFDAGTRTFLASPDTPDIGRTPIRVTALDSGGLSAQDTFDVIVREPNIPPSLNIPLTDAQAAGGQSFTYVVPIDTFIDPNIDETLTYSASLADGSALPNWLSFDPITRTFAGTPTNADVGNLAVNVFVSDSWSYSASDQFIITVVRGTLVGTAASETLTGSSGMDTLSGLGGEDSLLGLDGNDLLYGGDGDDTLMGGHGRDTLVGGSGNDRYVYLAGDGRDVIINADGGTDGIVFSGGIFESQLSFHRSGNDLVILVGGDVLQQVTVKDHFLGGNNSIDFVQTGDAGMLSAADIAIRLSALPDGVFVSPELGGNDSVMGTSGSDVLLGGSGLDTLAGGAGDDRLLGGDGDDRYVYVSGRDVLEETGGGNDTLVFSNGIAYNQVASGLRKSGNDLVLRVSGSTTNQITLKDYFLGGGNLVETIAFETGGQLTAAQVFSAFGLSIPSASTPFADTLDGTVADDDDLQGNSPAELIRGFNGDDQLFGDDGSDRLEGNNGADTLAGGTGDDTLLGGRGNDLYLFAPGDGQDVIDNIGGGFDELRFSGIDFSEVAGSLLKSGNDLVLRVSGTNDRVTVKNWFLGGDGVVDRISFESGGQLTAAQLFSAFGLSNPDPLGSPDYQRLPDERAFGTVLGAQSGNQIVFGSSDADMIDGGAGADDIRGGLGNDYLLGGDGSDTYRFFAGDGHDTINNLSHSASTDIDLLSFENIPKEDLWLEHDGDDLVLQVLGTNDSVRIQDWFADAAQVIDGVAFSDGTTWDTALIESILLSQESNTAPVLQNPLANQSASGGNVFNYVVPANAFYDADPGDSLTFSAMRVDGTALPNWLDFDPVSQAFSGTPSNSDAGLEIITVVATDTRGHSAAGNFTLSVVETNLAPFVNAPLADQNAEAGTAFTCVLPENSFGDANASDVLTYSATLEDGSELPGWLSFNQITRTFSGIPGLDDLGPYWVRVNVTDLGGLSTSDVFELLVTEPNLAPVLASPLDDQLAISEAPFSYTISESSFSDPNPADTLTYTAALSGGLNLPPWLAFDPISRRLYGTPTNSDAGVLSIVVTATDSGGLSASDTLELDVVPINHAPTVVQGNADQVLAAGDAFTFALAPNEFGDPDVNDVLQLSATMSDGSALPGWLAFDTGTSSFSGVAPASAETVVVAVRATDGGGLYASDSFLVSVEEAVPAVISVKPVQDQFAVIGSGFTYVVPGDTFTSSVPADPITVSALQTNGSALPAWLSFNSGSGVFSGTANSSSQGSFGLRLNAIGSSGAMASDDFVLNVANLISGTGKGNTLTGTALPNYIAGNGGADKLYGRDGNDWLDGGTGNDSLFGEVGDDWLDGGSGNDSLTGGTGSDTYVFGRSSASDTIDDFATDSGSVDVLAFDSDVSAEQIWLSRSGSNLKVSIIGTSNSATIQNWYGGNAYHVEQFRTADGRVLLDSQVDALVSAMAAFSPPAAGQTTLPQNYQDALGSVIATSWVSGGG